MRSASSGPARSSSWTTGPSRKWASTRGENADGQDTQDNLYGNRSYFKEIGRYSHCIWVFQHRGGYVEFMDLYGWSYLLLERILKGDLKPVREAQED